MLDGANAASREVKCIGCLPLDFLDNPKEVFRGGRIYALEIVEEARNRFRLYYEYIQRVKVLQLAYHDNYQILTKAGYSIEQWLLLTRS